MKTSRILAILFAAVLTTTMCATVAFAQQDGPPERRGPGGPGGPGGFRGGRFGMLPPEIMNTLTTDQKAQIKNIHESERTKMQELDNQALTQAQYRAQMMDLHKATQTQVEGLLNPDQKARLAAIRTQHEKDGPGADGPGHRGGPPPRQQNQ